LEKTTKIIESNHQPTTTMPIATSLRWVLFQPAMFLRPKLFPGLRIAVLSLHSLMAGIAAGMLANHDTDTCVRMGLLAARFSLCSYEPISPEISTSTVSQEQVQSKPWPEVKVWKLD